MRCFKKVIGVALLAGMTVLLGSQVTNAAEPISGRLAGGVSSVNRQDEAVLFKQHAQEVKTNVEVWEGRVRKRVAEIAKISRELDFRQLKNQKLALDELRAVLSELDAEAQEIIRAHAQLEPELQRFKQALLDGPAVFNRFAADLDRKASEKRTPGLKESYAEFGQHARKLAAAYSDRATGISVLETDLAKKVEYVQESREFIHDVQNLLEAIPIDGGLATEALVKRINDYVRVFEETINAMRGVADKLSEPQTSTSSQPTSAAPHTTTINGYRQRLSALSK